MLDRLGRLQALANSYVETEDSSADPIVLTLSYTRTGDYNTQMWQLTAGVRDAAFENYVNTNDSDLQSLQGMSTVTLPGGQMMPMGNMPGIRTNLPEDVIQNPLSVEEAHNGSIKAMLARNEGNYVVATFLVGTQGTVSWEGILYDVGNDFITIYQPGRERYIVTDIYALKYIEFYDTRRREQCEAMLKQNGLWNQR